VLQERAAFSGQIIDMDPRFVDRFGSPADENILMLPLVLKDKVAALVYADSGLESGRKLDSAAIELLVVSSSAWLELTSVRKQAPREGAPYAESAPPPPAQSAPGFSDPFAGHAPRHNAATAVAPAFEAPAAEVVSAPAAAHAEAAASATAMSEEAADTHRKAQRFARLLVDEIKLYNQAKVAEGRKNKDLYDRLKEDIEKSRSTYRKRYGNTAAADTDYFQVELVRSLAEDDISIMGANFRR
jgi:predicted lipid-binding transport protein (Tim44 family)